MCMCTCAERGTTMDPCGLWYHYFACSLVSILVSLPLESIDQKKKCIIFYF